MTALNKLASTAILAVATVFTASAFAGHGGGVTYPETEHPGQTTQPANNTNNNSNNNSNTNKNYNTNNNANNNTNKNYNNSSSSANNSNNIKVNVGGASGGAGGQGGAGGKGGAGGSAAANAAATGGAGGNASATGGTSSASTGSSTSGASADNGGLSNTNVNNYNQAKQVGNAPAVYLSPSGPCGEGVSFSVGFIGGAFGGGMTSQNRLCLSQNAANALMAAGMQTNDDGMIVGAMEAFSKIHPEIREGLELAAKSMAVSCAPQAAKRSRVLVIGLTEEKCAAMADLFKSAVVVPPKSEATPPAPQGPVIPECGSKPVVWDGKQKMLVCGNDLN